MQLSPFEAGAEVDRSYQAAIALGATRANVAIRDLPMQMNVVTEQLLTDRALDRYGTWSRSFVFIRSKNPASIR